MMNSQENAGNSQQSSSIDLSSEEQQFCFRPQDSNLAQQVLDLEGGLIALEADSGLTEIIIDKCIISHQLRERKEYLLREAKLQFEKQSELSQIYFALQEEQSELKKQIEVNRKAHTIMNQLLTSEETEKNRQQLQEQLAKHARLQNDSELMIKTEKLQQQILRKEKSEETMIEILKKKMDQERRQIQQLREKRREVKRRMQGEKQLQAAEQAERRAIKDKKLIADRVKLLQQDIQRMHLAIAKEQRT